MFWVVSVFMLYCALLFYHLAPASFYGRGPLRAAQIAVISTGVIMLVLSLVSYLRIQKVIGLSNSLHYTSEIKLQLETTYSNLRDADGALKSFLLSYDSSHYRKFVQRSQVAAAGIDDLKKMMSHPALKSQMEKLDSVVRVRDAIMLEFINEEQRRNDYLGRIRNINDYLDAQIDSISAAVETQEGDQMTRKQAVEQLTPFLLLAFQVVIVIVLFLAYRFIAKELRNRQLILGELKITNSELNRSFHEMKKQKDFIQAILDSSFNLIAVYDLEGRFISFNRQCEEQFGKKADQVLGKTFPEAFPGTEDFSWYKDLQRALRGEAVYTENFEAVAPGRFFQSHTVPVNDSTGNPLYIVAIAHEITPIVSVARDLREANEALIRQNEFAEALLNASVDSICVFDTSLRFVSINKTARELYGMGPEMIGKKLTEAFPQTTGSKTELGLLAAVDGVATSKLKHKSVVLDKIYESFFIPLKANDKVYAVMLIHHDVTDFVQASEALHEKNKELERSNSELEQFAFIASHDLQEPLRKIQTFTSIIEDENIEGTRRIDYVKKINAASARMSELIRNVLDFSKVRLVKPEFEEVNLNTVIRQAMVEQELLLKEKDGRIEFATLPTIKGSFPQLVQLFSNLLENAVKFTVVPPVVRITSEVVSENTALTKQGVADYHKISVTDNGIGFQDKFKDHIFEVFKRLHSQNEFKGTGIGLAICKRVVTNHNGFISVQSEVGKGSTFSIYLPLVQQKTKERVLESQTHSTS